MSAVVEWNPSETYKADARLPIAGPPCPGCKNWQPAQQFTPEGEYLGVRLCHAAEQRVDFTCFTARPGEASLGTALHASARRG